MNIVHITHTHWDAISATIANLAVDVQSARTHVDYPLMDRLMRGIQRAHALVPRYAEGGHAIQYLRFRQQWLVMMATDAEELAHVFGVFRAKSLAKSLRALATDSACWAQPLEVA